ncbi:OsmC family protein [Zhouia sp. PK063]|uniref:OsmC family protein n=1 Tax=Zhouia sp. PK063 TaxID=3373602 RepID=UPI0037975EF3
MKFTRKASANWKGTIKDGQGKISTDSTVLKDTQYSFKTRFEDGVGTNPEELIGAAHSGCYTMQLSALLSEKNYTPENLDTVAKVVFEEGAVVKIALELEGTVPSISKEEFLELANKAKEICPISKLLDTEITLEATLK